MNDTDYIRKAVELADGFQLTHCGRYFSMPHGGYVPTIDGCPQQYLDALAAQLRRQCRKIDKYCDVLISCLDDEGAEDYENFDEAMYDIKAIVDSGVLDTDREEK